MMTDARATQFGRPDVGVIGGSGLYSLLDDPVEVTIDTPWGETSAPITIGRLGDRSVAFIPRHGVDHEYSPQRVPYRANLWALRDLGVRRILAACASGSLQPDLAPGDFVVCDQLVNRTTNRADTYFDGDVVNHVSFAEPFCPELRVAALATRDSVRTTVHDSGTVVVIDGPRFSTRAESAWFRSNGWHVVNMTQYPEAVLARELGLCYATIAMVTDWDAAVDGPEVPSVTQSDVFAMLELNADRVRGMLGAAVQRIPVELSCDCLAATNGVLP